MEEISNKLSTRITEEDLQFIRTCRQVLDWSAEANYADCLDHLLVHYLPEMTMEEENALVDPILDAHIEFLQRQKAQRKRSRETEESDKVPRKMPEISERKKVPRKKVVRKMP